MVMKLFDVTLADDGANLKLVAKNWENLPNKSSRVGKSPKVVYLSKNCQICSKVSVSVSRIYVF